MPPAAAPAAQDLIVAVQAYDDFLTTAYDNEGYLAGHMNTDAVLNDARASSSARLRDVLGLPASSCAALIVLAGGSTVAHAGCFGGDRLTPWLR